MTQFGDNIDRLGMTEESLLLAISSSPPKLKESASIPLPAGKSKTTSEDDSIATVDMSLEKRNESLADLKGPEKESVKTLEDLKGISKPRKERGPSTYSKGNLTIATESGESSDTENDMDDNDDKNNDGLTSNISYEDLSKYFHLRIAEAADELGVCLTLLKRACRTHKIKRWPQRKITALDRSISSLKRKLATGKNRKVLTDQLEALRNSRAKLVANPNARVKIPRNRAKEKNAKEAEVNAKEEPATKEEPASSNPVASVDASQAYMSHMGQAAYMGQAAAMGNYMAAVGMGQAMHMKQAQDAMMSMQRAGDLGLGQYPSAAPVGIPQAGLPNMNMAFPRTPGMFFPGMPFPNQMFSHGMTPGFHMAGPMRFPGQPGVSTSIGNPASSSPSQNPPAITK